MGNVEHVEMCEISPEIQRPQCLTYWTTGIFYCTCGTCSYLTEKTRKVNPDRFDTLWIPQYVIKKGPTHGARHGNTERQRIYHAAHIAAKKAKTKGYNSILERFKIVHFTESDSSRLHGTKLSARTTTKFPKKRHTSLETPITPAANTTIEPPNTEMLLQCAEGEVVPADPVQWLYSVTK